MKQGDKIGPNLFTIFINDLLNYLLNTSDPVSVNRKDLHCLTNVDNIVLLSKTAKGLQEKLEKLDIYCKDWCPDVSTSNSKILIFNKEDRHIIQAFVFNNEKLKCI